MCTIEMESNNATRVVNINTNGFTVYIGNKLKEKDGYFGNPFPLNIGETIESNLIRYKNYFYNRLETDPEFLERVLELQNKTLGCFCKPKPCHGDIIVDFLENKKVTFIKKLS